MGWAAIHWGDVRNAHAHHSRRGSGVAVAVSVPESHPRYASLMARDRLTQGVEEGYVALQGLTAHGRGEAFDYLLGEQTIEPARRQIEAGTAALLAAEQAVVSVNGNVAALCPGAVAEFQEATGCRVEVNLFHRTDARVLAITERLEAHGCTDVLGVDPEERIPGLDHERGKVSREGIYTADCVLVPLEDGDRTEALVAMGKRVVAIDLNPLSRTAERASITIVDNVMRALPAMCEQAAELSGASPDALDGLLAGFDNQASLAETVAWIGDRLGTLAEPGQR